MMSKTFRKRAKWTQEEDAAITNFGAPDVEIAKSIGRSLSAIHKRRTRMRKRGHIFRRPSKPNVCAWLIQFYTDNPQEELSFSDIVKKYGCSLWTARQAVYELQRDGVLESVHVVRTRLKGMGR